MTVGENIRSFRKVNNLSQSQLAKKLYVTPQAVSRWENGETSPDLDTLGRMANIFNCSIDDIARGNEFSLKAYKLEQAYHFLSIVGGIFIIILSGLFAGIMLMRNFTAAVAVGVVYAVVALSFLISILVLEINAKKLRKKAVELRTEKE